MSALHPCPSCARHVRVAERACPFCAAVLALAATPVRPMPTQRLGRAATFAFGAAVVTSAIGCARSTTLLDDAATDANFGSDSMARGSDSGMYGGPPDAGLGGGHDAGTGSFDAAYGGAAHDAAPANDAAALGCPDTGLQPMYGGPPPPCDAGRDADMPDAWGAALYGAPPPPPGPIDSGH